MNKPNKTLTPIRCAYTIYAPTRQRRRDEFFLGGEGAIHYIDSRTQEITRGRIKLYIFTQGANPPPPILHLYTSRYLFQK